MKDLTILIYTMKTGDKTKTYQKIFDSIIKKRFPSVEEVRMTGTQLRFSGNISKYYTGNKMLSVTDKYEYSLHLNLKYDYWGDFDPEFVEDEELRSEFDSIMETVTNIQKMLNIDILRTFTEITGEQGSHFVGGWS